MRAACTLLRMIATGTTVKAPTFRTERTLAGRDCTLVAGVDEAGRGPWAGPVVAAAVIFAKPKSAPKGLHDSKLLTAERREALYDAIRATALVGVGIVSVEEIDRINILQATFRAMIDAVAMLDAGPDVVLVDGNRCPKLTQRAVPVIEGDRLCPSIAAASIIAKVTRDRMMAGLAGEFPGYGWHTNKGYGTPGHAEAIAKLGVTQHHRRSFAPIRAALEGRVNEMNEAALRSIQI
ncbi:MULTISPECIES: ribonuclease HII [Rhodomicrobium]|uniref:ribonuclease HII n=1 Tax=Rhodomicrobium TaxID=1068 RepID=UPI001FDA9228|nr:MULTISPECIES: ribonuclease HII [Rhodomicrobium]